jgi:AmmeMemoRadiSam system protein B
MVPASFRPRLRAVETIVVPDRRHGKVLVLRDTQGIAQGHAMLPPPLVPIVARFDGSRTCEQIARDVAPDLGEVPVDIVCQLATQLDEGLFLESATFEKALDKVKLDFDAGSVRAASHAGGAYPGSPDELAEYIDSRCIARANGSSPSGRMLGLVAPHIDPWRGAVGYGHAYGALAKALPSDADTFILFGTSHAPMREPFALCRKGYDTPQGVMPIDAELVETLAAASDFDPWHDRLNHKREHSLEFQAVFLRHVLGDREARIVPILAGLGEHQARGTQPAQDKKVAKFLGAVREIVEARPGKVIVVAGADLAHVGPRFGDPSPFNALARKELEATDRASLAHAVDKTSADFWSHVASDLETRRVCGLAPIFSLLEVLPEKSHGKVLHYEQTIDDEDGSIVSHAAVGFYG